MKPSISRIICWLFALAWLCAPPSLAEAQTATRDLSLSNYRLGSGDVITVEVLGEDDLKRERIRLSDAATISYPILGEIRLSGQPPDAGPQQLVPAVHLEGFVDHERTRRGRRRRSRRAP